MKINKRHRNNIVKLKSQSGLSLIELMISMVVGLFLLAGIGISALFSASYYYGNYKFGNSGYFFTRQLVFMLVGFIDKQIKLLNEEQSYVTEQNPTLMRGLFEANGTKKI